jgi:poly-gamma-glutamate synthesis protein (capsule biosynthesis protein)
MTLLGDVMLGGEFLAYAEKNKIDLLYPFEELEGYFIDSDILMINIEGPLSRRGERRPGVTTHLSNHPSLLEFLKRRKTCVAVMANNHVMDFGKEGLSDSLELLRSNGIHTVGAGMNKLEANRPIVVACQGKRIGIFAVTSDESHVGAVIASKDGAGCGSFESIDELKERIHDLRSIADIILVSFHWGNEYFIYPSVEQVRIAREIADAGANLIVGHHPHVIQGIEKYKNSIIIYSIGNFIFAPFRNTKGRIHYMKQKANEFIIINTNVDSTECFNINYIGGTVNKSYQMKVYKGSEGKDFQNYISNISKPFTYEKYDLFWEKYKKVRIKELNIENIFDAFKKIFKMPIWELLRTLTLDDIYRNLSRVKKVVQGRG